MIRGFADKETTKVWEGERSRRLPPEIQPVARRKLRQINRVAMPLELREPTGSSS